MTDDATDTLSERFDEITGALQDLSDVLDEYEDLATVLEHVVEGAVRIVPGADMAGVTLVSDESAKTVAATHPRVREVDQVQYANDGGPCLTASRDGRSVVVDVDQVRSRWPALEASAADLGIKSFIALPLMLSDRIHGSFNLYSSDPRGFQSLDESLLELFTTAAVTALQQAERHRRALASIRNLQTALTSRAEIDQAIGVVMALHGLPAAEAFDRLVSTSQDTNVKVRTVARQLLDKVATHG
ncbi:GAF and ANTAR domain-containing protein [Prescottella equi]|uniref:ANTAR domain-containing protein n=1 Tax=Rhodococcus hoagii TaxID=43767 RepID=A0A9Q2Z2E3_RHOHA|nr:GAF and ANTAR domain-containing protein [Prescottella equi]MBM4488761.1 ANTAR domain-containing protein [Prescottella equi]MBM4498873.1 ANTAR domain-containing protein [Prescottella equi]MBM4498879.1 ANTAR domain-containing protein [Prescottella equi]MBM4503835.1 ANTAR domain-containing protein [Prescottella equi]MBM4553200.1 ANTAR domain-containing protein [Prescottella equi]